MTASIAFKREVDALLSKNSRPALLLSRARYLETQADQCEWLFPWPRLADSLRQDAARLRAALAKRSHELPADKYAALDAAIVAHIKAGAPGSPLTSPSVLAVSAYNVIDRRLQSLSRANLIKFQRRADGKNLWVMIGSNQ